MFMRLDSCYCSSHCRSKGQSRVFQNLRDIQLQDRRRMSSSRSMSKSNSVSDVSTTSRTTCDGDDRSRWLRLGQFFLDAVLHRVASQSWGTTALRTYSSSMLWGRGLVQNSSAGALFGYLPEVDRYLCKSESSGSGCLREGFPSRLICR